MIAAEPELEGTKLSSQSLLQAPALREAGLPLGNGTFYKLVEDLVALHACFPFASIIFFFYIFLYIRVMMHI